jgi:hypothetical protein
MNITFTELTRIIAEAKGLPDNLWEANPIKLFLTEKSGDESVKYTEVFEVSEPGDKVPSLILRLDENREAMSIEFY